MATFKAEVYAHQKKEDGTYNIKIRVFHNGRKKYLATVWYVTKSDLTRTLKIKNQKYIDLTDDLIKKYRGVCDRVGERLKQMTVDQVVDCIRNEDPENFDLDFVAYAREHIRHLTETGHSGNAGTYKAAINNLVKFVGRENISIKEINVSFLSSWIRWIQESPALPNRKKGDRAPSHYFTRVRAVYNMAKKEFNDEDAGIIRIPYSPFSKVEVPKPSATRKRALSAEQLRQIAAVQYTDVVQYDTNRHNIARDVFLLSFCLMGMNAVDLYNCTDFRDGRITYQRTKTRSRRADKAEISVKVEPEVLPLVQKYRDESGQRVFRFYQKYSTHSNFNAALNKGLKQIGEELGIDDLEFYAARHSWATIAANDVGVDKYTVHECLNHVDENMKVTDIYIKKSWRHLDEANRRVMDYVNLKIENLEEPVVSGPCKKD